MYIFLIPFVWYPTTLLNIQILFGPIQTLAPSSGQTGGVPIDLNAESCSGLRPSSKKNNVYSPKGVQWVYSDFNEWVTKFIFLWNCAKLNFIFLISKYQISLSIFCMTKTHKTQSYSTFFCKSAYEIRK